MDSVALAWTRFVHHYCGGDFCCHTGKLFTCSRHGVAVRRLIRCRVDMLSSIYGCTNCGRSCGYTVPSTAIRGGSTPACTHRRADQLLNILEERCSGPVAPLNWPTSTAPGRPKGTEAPLTEEKAGLAPFLLQHSCRHLRTRRRLVERDRARHRGRRAFAARVATNAQQEARKVERPLYCRHHRLGRGEPAPRPPDLPRGSGAAATGLITKHLRNASEAADG